MVGIKETTDCVVLAAEMGNAVGKALADDGKITFGDSVHLGAVAIKVPAAISGIAQVGAELADLDQQETTTLVETFKTKFDIEQDKAEAMVEDYLTWLATGFAIFKKHHVKNG